jgi:hypothetical protein
MTATLLKQAADGRLAGVRHVLTLGRHGTLAMRPTPANGPSTRPCLPNC